MFLDEYLLLDWNRLLNRYPPVYRRSLFLKQYLFLDELLPVSTILLACPLHTMSLGSLTLSLSCALLSPVSAPGSVDEDAACLSFCSRVAAFCRSVKHYTYLKKGLSQKSYSFSSTVFPTRSSALLCRRRYLWLLTLVRTFSAAGLFVLGQVVVPY